MYSEARYTYRKEDKFEPAVEAFESALDGEKIVSFKLTNTFVQGELHSIQQLVLKFGLEHAKTLVAKLQEGIDQHENKIGS